MPEGNALWRELCELERIWEMQFDDGTYGRVDALTREQCADPMAQGTELAEQVMRNATERLRGKLGHAAKMRERNARWIQQRETMLRRAQAKRRAA